MKVGKFSLLAVLLLLSLLLLTLPQATVASTPEWTKFPANPVISPGAAGAWDEGGVGAGSVILDGSTYKIWYTGIDASGVARIGLATSDNGIDWTKDAGNPVLDAGDAEAWDEAGAGSPSVIKDETTYKMWYTGVSATDVPAIGYATSTDGIDWTKDAANPVWDATTLGENWADGGVLSASVIKDSGTYKMWYTGRTEGGVVVGGHGDLGVLAIGHAESLDGVVWSTPEAVTNPVLGVGDSGDWDEEGVGVAVVVQSGTSYTMYYTGVAATGTALGMATSTDGIVWTRDAGNPILSTGAGWEGIALGAPSVLADGTNARMWYSGSTTSLSPQTGYAYYYPTATTTLKTGWNMFSLPLDPTPVDNNFAYVLDELNPALADPPPFYLYHYDPTVGGYQTYPTMPMDAATGKAYWAFVLADTPVTVEGAAASDAPKTIDLKAGWNQIGQYFQYSVDWGSATITYEGETVSTEEAHLRGYILGRLYYYDTVNKRYESNLAPDGQLDPWGGYWVRAYVDVTLTIPNTPMP